MTTTNNRRKHGMHVNLAAISAAYLAVFGEQHPSTMPYADAAELMRNERPDDWDAIFVYAMEAIHLEGGGYPTYATSSAAIRAKFRIGGQS